MKRYLIKYGNEKSEVERHTCYCLGEADLNATLVDLVIEGNFIDWLGWKEADDTIMQYQEISEVLTLRKLGIASQNDINEEKAYKAWGL